MPTPKTRYLIAYDIEDDRLRTRVASTLEATGWRVQKSVFECLLDPKALDRLTAKLSRQLQSKEGSQIRIYRLCSRCLEASFGLGDITPGAGSSPWIIV